MSTNPSTEQGAMQRTQLYPFESGFMQGIQIGLTCGIQKSILKILSYRFSKLPFGIGRVIFGVSDVDKLEQLLEVALTVDSPEEFMKNG